jgi:hypothetical protein
MYLEGGSLHGTLEVLATDFTDDVLGCGVLDKLWLGVKEE